MDAFLNHGCNTVPDIPRDWALAIIFSQSLSDTLPLYGSYYPYHTCSSNMLLFVPKLVHLECPPFTFCPLVSACGLPVPLLYLPGQDLAIEDHNYPLALLISLVTFQ